MKASNAALDLRRFDEMLPDYIERPYLFRDGIGYWRVEEIAREYGCTPKKIDQILMALHRNDEFTGGWVLDAQGHVIGMTDDLVKLLEEVLNDRTGS